MVSLNWHGRVRVPEAGVKDSNGSLTLTCQCHCIKFGDGIPRVPEIRAVPAPHLAVTDLEKARHLGTRVRKLV